MQPLVGLDADDLRALLPATEPPYRARQLYEAVYRQRAASLQEISNLPQTLRERLAAACTLGYPKTAARYQSADLTRRYLLELDDGRRVEAVFMPEEHRDTLCISSQAGCPVGCKFCLTASMGLERNLTAGEIVGQVLCLAADNGLWADQRRLNIVMMGQGEPLLNLAAVLKATRLLCDPKGLNVSPRRITVSTSGIIAGMEELGRAAGRPRLAISLNASSQEQRAGLMPIAKKYRLADLIEACRAYPLRPWERLTFEYVLLGGVNDSDADAHRVVRLLAHIKCKVNLIALNPGPGIPFETPAAERVAAFQSIVGRSLPCFVRKPRGLDIYAACGQLKLIESGPATP